jgi:hypothetical protein
MCSECTVSAVSAVSMVYVTIIPYLQYGVRHVFGRADQVNGHHFTHAGAVGCGGVTECDAVGGEVVEGVNRHAKVVRAGNIFAELGAADVGWGISCCYYY